MKHLGLQSGAAKVALLTGDPERVPLISKVLGGRHITNRRGFLCHVADLKDGPLAIVATGIGGPATAIVAEELIALGVRAIIRVGTCGALQGGIEPHDLIIPSGCVRDEGTSRAYMDLAFPAIAHSELHRCLVEAAVRNNATAHIGITHCKDAYYSEQPGKQPDAEGWARRWAILRTAGVLATEMEAAPLFVIGSLRRVPVAAVLVNVGKEPLPGFEDAIHLAVRVCLNAFEAVSLSGLLSATKPSIDSSDHSYLTRPRSDLERLNE